VFGTSYAVLHRNLPPLHRAREFVDKFSDKSIKIVPYENDSIKQVYCMECNVDISGIEDNVRKHIEGHGISITSRDIPRGFCFEERGTSLIIVRTMCHFDVNGGEVKHGLRCNYCNEVYVKEFSEKHNSDKRDLHVQRHNLQVEFLPCKVQKLTGRYFRLVPFGKNFRHGYYNCHMTMFTSELPYCFLGTKTQDEIAADNHLRIIPAREYLAPSLSASNYGPAKPWNHLTFEKFEELTETLYPPSQPFERAARKTYDMNLWTEEELGNGELMLKRAKIFDRSLWPAVVVRISNSIDEFGEISDILYQNQRPAVQTILSSFKRSVHFKDFTGDDDDEIEVPLNGRRIRVLQTRSRAEYMSECMNFLAWVYICKIVEVDDEEADPIGLIIEMLVKFTQLETSMPLNRQCLFDQYLACRFLKGSGKDDITFCTFSNMNHAVAYLFRSFMWANLHYAIRQDDASLLKLFPQSDLAEHMAMQCSFVRDASSTLNSSLVRISDFNHETQGCLIHGQLVSFHSLSSFVYKTVSLTEDLILSVLNVSGSPLGEIFNANSRWYNAFLILINGTDFGFSFHGSSHKAFLDAGINAEYKGEVQMMQDVWDRVTQMLCSAFHITTHMALRSRDFLQFRFGGGRRGGRRSVFISASMRLLEFIFATGKHGFAYDNITSIDERLSRILTVMFTVFRPLIIKEIIATRMINALGAEETPVTPLERHTGRDFIFCSLQTDSPFDAVMWSSTRVRETVSDQFTEFMGSDQKILWSHLRQLGTIMTHANGLQDVHELPEDQHSVNGFDHTRDIQARHYYAAAVRLELNNMSNMLMNLKLESKSKWQDKLFLARPKKQEDLTAQETLEETIERLTGEIYGDNANLLESQRKLSEFVFSGMLRIEASMACGYGKTVAVLMSAKRFPEKVHFVFTPFTLLNKQHEQTFLQCGIRAVLYTDYKQRTGLPLPQVLICSYEHFEEIIPLLLSLQGKGVLGTILVDEVHVIFTASNYREFLQLIARLGAIRAVSVFSSGSMTSGLWLLFRELMGYRHAERVSTDLIRTNVTFSAYNIDVSASSNFGKIYALTRHAAVALSKIASSAKIIVFCSTVASVIEFANHYHEISGRPIAVDFTETKQNTRMKLNSGATSIETFTTGGCNIAVCSSKALTGELILLKIYSLLFRLIIL